jgi:hypothetical protein
MTETDNPLTTGNGRETSYVIGKISVQLGHFDNFLMRTALLQHYRQVAFTGIETMNRSEFYSTLETTGTENLITSVGP